MLNTTIDAVPQSPQAWSPSVSILFDEGGNLLGVSSLAPDPYYPVNDGTRQATLQSISDQDRSCVSSRLASGFELAKLTGLVLNDNSVWLEFESEFGGHVQYTAWANGRATQNIELDRQVDGLLCTVTYTGEYDITENAGPEAGVTKHVVETFTASTTLMPTDPTELVPYEDTCQN